jgi:hypothetical protein
MSFVAKGTFTVEMKSQAEPNAADGVSLGRMSLDKRFEGDLVATGKGEMLTALTPIKDWRVCGHRASDRDTARPQGSFVFQHTGPWTGSQQLSITVVPAPAPALLPTPL